MLTLFNTDKDRMFFLINKKDEEIRRSDNRMALRRARRKMPNADSFRLVTGDTLGKALKAEEKANKEATLTKVTKKVKPLAKKAPVKKVVQKKVEKKKTVNSPAKTTQQLL